VKKKTTHEVGRCLGPMEVVQLLDDTTDFWVYTNPKKGPSLIGLRARVRFIMRYFWNLLTL